MIVLQTNQLTKAFGVVKILTGVDLILQDRARLGLVGVNGSGKTTLLRILAGEMPHDEGQLTMQRGLKIGYHSQLDDLNSPLSVFDELKTVFEPLFAMEAKLRAMESDMGELHEKDPAAFARLSEEYARLTDDFEHAGGYEWRSRLIGVLTGLGFGKERYDQPVNLLSGGERTRLKLGKLLLCRFDVILLDEPTNHLDLDSTKWLEDFLKTYKGAVIVVSHDRYFLDAVCTGMAELSFGKVEQYEGNYTRYLYLRNEVMERRMKEYTLQQKEIEREKRIIMMFRTRPHATEAMFIKARSREKRLAMLDIKEKPVAEQHVHFRFEAGGGTGQDVLYTEGLSKGYDGRQLFSNVNIHIRAGDRVALLGANGCGKTTLLRILMGLEQPDEGGFRFGAGVKVGYYDQQQEGLSPEKTVLDEIWDDFPRMEQTDVRSALAAFLFTGEDVLTPVKGLSGGERGRVMLTKLMLRKDNVLLLDEPTNHLDMDSRECLETTLDDFSGTILTVSHDRYFINRIANRVLVMKDGAITEYLGNYDDYLEKLALLTHPEEEDRPTMTKTAQREEKRREREAREAAKRERDALMNLETRIAEAEESMTKLEIELSDPDLYQDPARAATVNKRYTDLKQKLEDMYAAWEQMQEG